MSRQTPNTHLFKGVSIPQATCWPNAPGSKVHFADSGVEAKLGAILGKQDITLSASRTMQQQHFQPSTFSKQVKNTNWQDII